jgi:hypothetical protein
MSRRKYFVYSYKFNSRCFPSVKYLIMSSEKRIKSTMLQGDMMKLVAVFETHKIKSSVFMTLCNTHLRQCQFIFIFLQDNFIRVRTRIKSAERK